MAGASAKKQVQTNLQLLKFLEILLLVTYTAIPLSVFYFRRPASSKPFLVFSIPVLLSFLVIEKTGRPTFDGSGRVLKTGQDLRQQGLTEYLFDIIYVTVTLDFLSVALGSNKVWWAYSVIPIFGGYKAFEVVNAGRKMLGFGGEKKREEVKSGSNGGAVQEKSKRQTKREARGDKPKMKYR